MRPDTSGPLRLIEAKLAELGKIVNQHANMINQHQKFVARETARQILQAEKDIVSHAIEKGQGYTRAILFAGYAGFFTFWIFMKDKMDEITFVGAGLFMSISLSIFIFYTVWQNISLHKVLLGRLACSRRLAMIP